MGFMSDISRLMKVATKPDRNEIWLVTKVTALGMSALGLLGFIIKIAGEVVFSGVKSNNTSAPAAGGFILQFLTILMHVLK